MKSVIQLFVIGAVAGGLAFPVQAQEAVSAAQAVQAQAVTAVPVEGNDGNRAHDRFNQKYDKELFDRIGENDGYISLEDFSQNANARDTLGGRVTPEYLRQFDADGDGQLNIGEAKKARQNMWEHTAQRAREFKEKHPNADWQDVRDRYRERRENNDEGRDRRERYLNAKEKHPVAVNRAAEQALQHPDAARKVRKDALEHDKARRTLYRDAKQNPKAADWAADRIENNKKDAKRAYKNTTDKEKMQAYRQGKKNRKQIKENPGQAKRRALRANRNR